MNFKKVKGERTLTFISDDDEMVIYVTECGHKNCYALFIDTPYDGPHDFKVLTKEQILKQYKLEI